MSKIRITVQTSDFGDAANVGGPVVTKYRSFDIEAPELVAFLREYETAEETRQNGKCIWWNRSITSTEVLP